MKFNKSRSNQQHFKLKIRIASSKGTFWSIAWHPLESTDLIWLQLTFVDVTALHGAKGVHLAPVAIASGLEHFLAATYVYVKSEVQKVIWMGLGLWPKRSGQCTQHTPRLATNPEICVAMRAQCFSFRVLRFLFIFVPSICLSGYLLQFIHRLRHQQQCSPNIAGLASKIYGVQVAGHRVDRISAGWMRCIQTV